MIDVYNGEPGCSPTSKKQSDVGLRRGIIARAPARILEAFLHIDDEEGSAIPELEI